MNQNNIKSRKHDFSDNIINENQSDSDFLLSQKGSESSIKVNKELNENLPEEINKNINNFPQYLNDLSKELQESLKIKNWTLQNLFTFSPTIIASIIYLFTLRGCTGAEINCMIKHPPSILKYFILAIFTSGLLFTLQFIIYTLGKCNKLQLVTSAFTMIFLCFLYDSGNDFKSHGSYNRLVLLIAVLICTITYTIIYLIFYSVKLRPILSILTIITLLYFSYLKISSSIQYSCYDWEKGFKNSKIDNTGSRCKIYPPGTCYFKLLDGLFDVTKVFGLTCNNMPSNKWSNNELSIDHNSTKIFGFPRTEKFSIFPQSNNMRLSKNVMEGLINMEDPNIGSEQKQDIEVTLDISRNPPQPSINLKYDEKLVSQRRERFKTYENEVLSKNVIFIFIDSLSRTNLRRKLPKFYKWIEDKYQPDIQNKYGKSSIPKDKVQYESFQFLKYHGVGRYTGINMVPTYFGVFNIYYMGRYFLTQYKNRGYITGQSLTYCGREVFDIDDGAIEKMEWDNYDHEMVSLFCDGNYSPHNADHYPIFSGPNSVRLRCLYNKSILSYSLDYLNQFWTAYQNEPKFFRIGLTEAHEGTQEVIKYSDDELYNFFSDFEKRGYLKDTIIYIQSDHGLSMPGPYNGLEDYEYEAVLPAFFMILPTNMKDYDIIRETVKHNQNSMLTPFTIYNSLYAIVNYFKYSYFDQENDIFFYETPKSNECSSFHDYDYYFDKEFLCRCKQ